MRLFSLFMDTDSKTLLMFTMLFSFFFFFITQHLDYLVIIFNSSPIRNLHILTYLQFIKINYTLQLIVQLRLSIMLMYYEKTRRISFYYPSNVQQEA